MSHFSVLVVGEDVEKQLAPYHEFECTGNDDEYVQDLDITEECRREYEEATSLRYQDVDGLFHDPYEDRFYRDPTPEEGRTIGPFTGTGCGSGLSWTSKDWGDGRGYRPKIHLLPEGWTEVRVESSEVMSFADHVEGWHGHSAVPYNHAIDLKGKHKYGYVLLGKQGEVVKVIDRSNPNKQWNWWVVGGRFTGFFRLKPGSNSGHADSALKRDIDFDGMRIERVEKYLPMYLRYHDIVAGRPIPDWNAIREKHSPDIGAARKEYNSSPVVQDLGKDHDFFMVDHARFNVSKDDFIRNERASAIATFAVLKDGVWSERGSMGWWGVVHDESDKQEWCARTAELIDGLPDDTRLTIVDCHI